MPRRKTQAECEAEALKQNLKFKSIYSGRNNDFHEYECLVCSYEFLQIPSSVQQGFGCARCSGMVRTQKDCEKDAEARHLIFMSIYSGSCMAYHEYMCKVCLFSFLAKPNSVQQGTGCARCSGKLQKTQNVCEAEALKCDLLFKSVYSGHSKTRHNYECLICKHRFTARPDAIQQGQRCPKCAKKYNRGFENAIFNGLLYSFPDALQNIKGVLPNKRFELDVWVPSLRKAIECDGWHNKPESAERDARKNKECKEVGVELLRLKYSDYKRGKNLFNLLVLAIEFLAVEIPPVT